MNSNNTGYILGAYPVHPHFTKRVKRKRRNSGGSSPTPRIFAGWSNPALNIFIRSATSGYCAIPRDTGRLSLPPSWKPCAAAVKTAALGWRPATKRSAKPAWSTIATCSRRSLKSMALPPERSLPLSFTPPRWRAMPTWLRLPTPLPVH